MTLSIGRSSTNRRTGLNESDGCGKRNAWNDTHYYFDNTANRRAAGLALFERLGLLSGGGLGIILIIVIILVLMGRI